MASITSSGTVLLSDIRTVFGGSNPVRLSNYYANATTGYTSGITGIPNLGSIITLQHFRGKSKGAANGQGLTQQQAQ